MKELLLLVLVLIFLFLIWHVFSAKSTKAPDPLPANFRVLLQQYVAFYRGLTENEKLIFEQKLATFLAGITIEGVRTKVDDLDKVLIGASAVIPIFGFRSWHYSNLSNILLYPEHFNEGFSLQDKDRRVMGMVGTGAMNDKMILSKPALHEGFKNETDKSNTAIHEFVHLLDKADGDIDGIPEALLEKQYTIPWINLMHQKIEAILNNQSDINPYGATSKTEFFAVASEYFFERPKLFQSRHPELFRIMEKIFDQTPEVASAVPKRPLGRNEQCHCGSGKKYKNCHEKK